MCRQTQRQWLKGEYPSTSYEGGLACPSFTNISTAYGIPAYSLKKMEDSERLLTQMFLNPWAELMDVEIGLDQGLSPQAKFGCALEDQEPTLPREELAQIMEAA